MKFNSNEIINTITSIYGPNKDEPEFFDRIIELVKEFDSDEICLCGSWNLVLSQTLDTCNYKNINYPKARDKDTEMMDTFDLMDPLRELNYDRKRYTWRQPTPIKQARLDFFQISHNLLRRLKIVTLYQVLTPTIP